MHPRSTPVRDRQAFQELANNYELTVDQELRKAWGVSYNCFVEQLLQFANVQKSETVLDLATGTGLIPRSLAAGSGSAGPFVGVDITFSALNLARKRAEPDKLDPSIAFTCASALALPFALGSFDCVICALATHHLAQDELLDQVWSVLKPKGRFILADVIASPTWSLPGVKPCLRLAAYVYFLCAASPARAWVESQAVSYVYTKEEWTRALQKHNFTSIQIFQPRLQPKWLPSGMMISALKGLN